MRQSVIQALKEAKNATCRFEGQSIVRVNDSVINVRTATQKAGLKYWFDVTPSFYGFVHFFLFACGNASTVYVFPASELQHLIEGASLGGQKQVPNFTIFSGTNELEPAGLVGTRKPISQYLNAYALIP